MKKNRLFTFLFLFFANILLFAQNNSEEFKAFKAKYSSKEFDYWKVKEVEQPKNYEPNKLTDFIDNVFSSLVNLPWKYMLIFFIVLFLVLIGYRISKNGGFFKPNSKKLETETDFDYIEENLTEVNLEHLIDKAEKENNYPLAIRYLHYQNLQNLSKKNLIDWDPKLTNQQLINQIKSENIRNQFSKNTLIFNQIWFGEFIIDASQYQNYKAMYNQLNRDI